MSCCSQRREIQSNNCRVYRSVRMLPRQILVLFFKGYRYVISPLFPPACRYTPTCSQYAIEAVSRYGVIRGTCMAGWRILRCHPFSRGGYDPVE